MLAAMSHKHTRAVQSYKKFVLKLTFRVARYPNETLGQKIRKLRLEKGLKQIELASALGVNEDTVRNWEKGRMRPARGFLRKLEGYFGGRELL